MPSAWIIWTVAMIVLSFFIGSALYYVVTEGEAKAKLKTIEHVLSFVINVVLYMWLTKIVLHVSMFIEDPFALLAYPSTRQAFYGGIILAIVHVIWRGWNDQYDGLALFEAFVPIFIFSSFAYEFMQLIERKSSYELPYVIVLAIATLSYVLSAKWTTWTRAWSSAVLWLIGVFILQWVMPVVTMYHYRITFPFIVVTLFGLVVLHQMKKRRKK